MATEAVFSVKGELQCAGCGDIRRITKHVSETKWGEVVEAFALRHQDCERQGTLPKGDQE